MIGWFGLRVHPDNMIGEEHWAALEAFEMFRPSGFSAGILPGAGGWMDQAAAMIACFGVIADIQAKVKPKE